MGLNELTPELRDKVLTCETPEEILALAQEEGRELTDDELEAVAGGEGDWKMMCPKCMSLNTEKRISVIGTPFYVCLDCEHRFTTS